MREIINCIQCGEVCVDNPNRLCPQCYQELLDAEIIVADYLRTRGIATIDEVYMATKIKKHIIMKMIREGRITEGNLSYLCSCGASITSGQFCMNCLATMAKSATPEKPDDKQEKKNECFHIEI